MSEGWRDIATAPRDGTRILGWVCSRHSVRRGVPMVIRWLDFDWRSGGQTVDRDSVKLWQPIVPPDTEDDITAGLEALNEPIVAEWGEVKDRLNLGKED